MKIKKERRLYADDVMNFCRKKELYTCGNCSEYGKMLDMRNKDNITDNQLFKIAYDILLHSDTERDIENIMFELSEISHTFYNVEI